MKIDPRLLRLARTVPGWLVLTIGLGFVGGLLTLGQARLLTGVVNDVFLGGKGLREVYTPLGLLLGAILLRSGMAWAAEISSHRVAAAIKRDLRRRIYARLVLAGPLSTHSTSSTLDENTGQTGELVNTAVEGVEALEAYFSQYLPQVVLAAFVPLTFLIAVFPIDPLSGLVLLCTAPLIPLFMALIGSQAEALTRRQWQSLSRMSAFFLDILQGLTALKLLGRSREQAARVARVSEHYRQTTMGVLRVTFLSALALELISTLSTAVVAVEVGVRLLEGYLSFEQAFFVLVLAPEFYLPLRLLGTRFHAGMAGVAAAGRIFELLERGGRRPEAPERGSRRENGIAPGVVFEQVGYTYPDGRAALHEISFTLPAGKTTALVGPSGAGKSTLAGLLLGFVAPTTGRVSFSSGNCPTLAWVPQQPYLFNDTVAANLRLARPEATDEELAAAARLAHADDFIRALPQGYATLIGERGTRLSGGQAQRLSLARAFLLDAPLLILDEPTANLDPATEDAIQQATARLAAGRTVLVIAHRLNTVRRADQIVVLDAGRLAQIGLHEELIAREGLYRQLSMGGPPLPMAPEPLPVLKDETFGRSEQSQAGESGGQRSTIPNAPSPRTVRRPSLLGLLAPFAGQVALSALLGALTVGSSIGLVATAAYIIASAALHPSISVLNVAVVGVRFFGLSRGIFRYLERLVSHSITFRLLARLRLWFYQAIEPLAPARLSTSHSGDLLNRVTGDIASLENFYVRSVAPPLTALLVTVGSALFLALFHPLLGGVLLVFHLLAGIGVPLLARGLSRAPGRQAVSARAALNVILVDGIQGLADLLAFGAQGRQAERLESAQADLAAAQGKLAHVTGIQVALGVLFSNLGMWAIVVLAIPQVRQGTFSGVALAVLALAALASFEAALPLPLAAQYLEGNLQAARRLFELADALPEVVEPPEPAPLPATWGLEIEHLTFTYPQASGPALDDFSLNLPSQGCIALVGPSGAGKSTLAHLLLRFWEYRRKGPQGAGGQILLNGRPLNEYSPEALRQSIAVVSQNTYLFAATLRDNLLLARPEASEAELVRAAQQAHIHDFIQSLPQGYDTWVGEHGLRFSGGERQRMAIARALLKNAPLLILDEPTANLDTVTEGEVMATLRAVMPGRAVLLITHRLVGLEQMDEIIVLDEGKVVERGRQADLLARGGLYARLWALSQALP